jgi:protein CMS1
MNIGVGTPQRVIDLLEDGKCFLIRAKKFVVADSDIGALSTKSLKRIVLDASHMDQKKCGILDMKDTQVPLLKLLNMPHLKERYGTDGGIDLIFY